LLLVALKRPFHTDFMKVIASFLSAAVGIVDQKPKYTSCFTFNEKVPCHYVLLTRSNTVFQDRTLSSIGVTSTLDIGIADVLV
jgi:hypothetical protein